MATQPSEFIELSAELIDDEFGAFKSDLTIKKTDYDPVTDTDVNFSGVIGAIPIDLKTAENIFSNVTADDVYVVFRNVDPVPSDFDASYNCSFNDKDYNIEDVVIDPAGAAYFVRLNI